MSSITMIKEFLTLTAMLGMFYLWAVFGYAALGG